MGIVRTELCDLLGINHPIVQAGMGPSGTLELAVAVTEAGGLGMMSAGDETAGERQARANFEEFFDYMIENTDGNFGVNVPVGSSKMTDNVQETLDAYIEQALVSNLTNDRVADQMVLLETSAGNPERWMDDIKEVKEETGLLHFHKVASVEHAKKAEELGVDGITASGYEMAGHTHQAEDATHTFVLVPAVADAVDIPVLASGGVRDGRGLLAALALGASGIYMGSRFIATQEADFHDEFKEYVIDAEPGADTIIDGQYGPLRVLNSPGIEQIEAAEGEMDAASLKSLKAEKFINAQQGNIDDGIVIASQAAGYIDDQPTVEELIQDIVDEAARVHSGMDVSP